VKETAVEQLNQERKDLKKLEEQHESRSAASEWGVIIRLARSA